MEAVRYTEGSNIKRKKKTFCKKPFALLNGKNQPGTQPHQNGGHRSLPVAGCRPAQPSLSAFTNGFDMDKYLANFVTSDFVLADARYFQTGALSLEATPCCRSRSSDEVEAQGGGITEGGRVYGRTLPFTGIYHRGLLPCTVCG